MKGLCLGKVGIQPATAHPVVCQVLVEYWRTEVQRLLADVDLLDYLFRCLHPSQPERRGEDLGETAQVDGAFWGEAAYGRNIRSFVSERPVRAVLHNQEVSAPGQVHQLLPLLKCHCRSGRIPEVGDDICEFYLAAASGISPEFIQGAERCPVVPERLDSAKVCGTFCQDHFSRVEENPAADIDSLLGKVKNSRQNALDSGADDVLSKAFKAAEAEYERLRKLAEQGDNSAELAERLKNLSDFYEGLSAFSEAKKKKERIDDGGYADHGRKAYDHGSSLLDELSNIDDFDARLAADAEAFAAGGKAATSGFGSEFLKKAKQADSDFSAVFKAAANNERSDALKAKKQADSVKASVSRKTDYDTGVNYFRTGDTNYVTGSIEASILNYVDAKEMFAKLYSEISKLRAAAQKHIDAAKKRVSSSDAKAGEADRTDPLTEKIVGIEDPDAKLLEDDDFTEAANSYVELDEELSAGGSL